MRETNNATRCVSACPYVPPAVALHHIAKKAFHQSCHLVSHGLSQPSCGPTVQKTSRASHCGDIAVISNATPLPASVYPMNERQIGADQVLSRCDGPCPRLS